MSRSSMSMLAAVVAFASLPACGSNWEVIGVDTSCVQDLWFHDADGDRWGVVTDEFQPVASCGAPGDTYTARNDRDCNDDDPNITGRIGSLCPDQLVHYDNDLPASVDDYDGFVIAGTEYLVVHPDDDALWAEAAEDACSPWGWGGMTPRASDDAVAGHLATFGTVNELTAQQDGLLSQLARAGVTDFGGFVGYSIEQSAWAYRDEDLSGEVTWVVESEQPSSTPYCDSNFPPPTPDPVYEDDQIYLALVWHGNVTDGGTVEHEWCLGEPWEIYDDPADPDNTGLHSERYGHYICERPAPDPADWAVDIDSYPPE